MTQLFSPIAVDMGAKNTGACLLHFREDGSLSESRGWVLTLPDKGLQFLQQERRIKRHQRRGQQRRRLARRLLDLLLAHVFEIHPDTLSRREREALWGIFNRRGFTYYQEDKGDLKEALRAADSQHPNHALDIKPLGRGEFAPCAPSKFFRR